MYLLELNISNMKSEALAQGCSKIGILKNSAELTEKQLLCAGVSFIMKVQTSWINQYILGSHFTRQECFPMKFAKFLRTPFENTNSSVEHLRSCKVLFVDC